MRISLTTDPGDSETLQLIEDAVDSGRFVGYVVSTAAGAVDYDCALGGGVNVTITADYANAANPNDRAQARAAFDPISRVFLASSGAPINGASIALVDANGAPARVFGDDGASAYPSTETAGVDATDASGARYVYGPGEYRFPVVADGTYRLRVTPPHRFGFPSSASDTALQTLPGAPYALSGASRGALFTIAGGASRVDVPLDLLPLTPTKASLEIFALGSGAGAASQYVGATQCANGSGVVAAPAPVSRAGAVTVPGAVALQPSAVFGGGEPVFVVLTDPDQDVDPFAADTVRVVAHSGVADVQTLILTETGASTGVFSGYLQLSRAPPASDDCALGVAAGATFSVEYRDAHDTADSVSRSAVVDPGSRVINSATGDVIDGVTITLLDAATGQPAVNAVFADDGVTPFPTTVVSGAGATDASGAHLDFAAGTFRFPFVVPGTYRFKIAPPVNYTFPSAIADSQLQRLAGAPFVLSGGSRGADFSVTGTQPLQLDVPLDPVEVDVFVTKQANKEVAAVGDFVQYHVIVQNADAAGVVTKGALIDELPKGFRYVADSARVNGVRVGDPTVARDGRTLRFALPTVAAASTVAISYVTEIGSGAELGEARNAAHVIGVGVGSSNTATASVTVREDLLTSKAIIIGRVIDGACGAGASAGTGLAGAGLAGVRVLLEDGTYVVTDDSGKYHIEGVNPGTHVVQVDLTSLPETYELVECAPDTRHAGTAFSQFVDVQGGTLWRADFFASKKPPLTSPVTLRLDSAAQAQRATFELALSGGTGSGGTASGAGITLSGVTAVVTLPDSAHYVADSARLDGNAIAADGTPDDGALTFRLGDTTAASTHTLTFAADIAGDASAPTTVKALAMFDVDGKHLRTPVAATTVDLSSTTTTSPAVADDSGNVTVVEVTAQRTLTARRPFEIPQLMDAKLPAFDLTWLANQTPEPAIVWPLADANPRIPAVWVVVKHLPDQRVALTVAGVPVDGLSFDGTEVDRERGVALTRYRNVTINEGDNAIVARLVSADGAVEATLSSSVHYSGAPVRAELDPAHSYLIADGITPSVIAVRLLDRDGAPARPGMTGVFDVRPPFQVLAPPKVLGQALTPQTEHDVYVVRDDGIAYVELQPTTESGSVELEFEFDGYRYETVRTRIAPSTRDWVLVGFGEGTLGYNDVSGNMEALRATDIDKDLSLDGRSAFYAKGRVRGEWLLTLAYDSASGGNDVGQDEHGQHSLGQQIDPNKYYTLYGDGAEQRYDAQTQSKLYVRLERPDFVALFGDFDTGFNAAELTRYTRRLNGARAEYYGERVRLEGFAAQTDQGFVRDDLRGDGTSGEYRLSSGGVVINSETLHIEVRDRFKSEVVLKQQTLSRYLDYTIDYARGTLLFKQPVPYQDALFNPVYIVAEYEIGGPGAPEEVVGGGRVAYRIGTGQSEVGVSYVHDGAPNVGGDLGGVDVTLELPLQSVLTLGGAATDTDRHGTANAYLAQLEHSSGDLAGRAYLREQQVNFGLGQQSAIESGTRKIGAEGEYRFTDVWSARLDAFQQTYLVADSERKVAESQLVYERGAFQFEGGLRAIREDTAIGISRDANQATLGSTQTLDGGRLKLNAIGDIDLGGTADNIDYPTRLLTGAEYLVASGISILAEQEFTFGDVRDTQNSHVGIKAQPWTGANVNAAVGRRQGENGERLYATTGLVQAWQVDERWRVDFGMDRVKTLSHDLVAEVPPALTYNPNVPLTSGSIDDDFTAAFVGFGYRQGDWDATSRLEYHYGDQVDKWNLLAGMSRQLDDGKVVSASFALLESQQSNGAKTNQGDLRVGAAWRPVESDWAFLNRLDLVFDENRSDAFDTTTRKLVENMNANYAPGSRWQLAVQLGGKYALDDIDGENYSGATTLTGLEYRYNLTPRWDVGVRGSLLHSFGTDTTSYSTGASVGYNPYKNAWVSVGYNVTGFEDRDFAGADYTAQGPYLKLRFKVDQQSVREFLDYASLSSRSATDAPL